VFYLDITLNNQNQPTQESNTLDEDDALASHLFVTELERFQVIANPCCVSS